jgi:hypothetical protein
MRYLTLVVLCIFSLSASAQFWKKKKPVIFYPRYELLPGASGDFSITISNMNIIMPEITAAILPHSVFEIELAEEAVLKMAKHNMRFRIYDAASYNFTELAELYMSQNRFSEAKWYLLQSNEISRQQNNHKHTVSNLLDLATIKLAIGEMALAKIDLLEAHNLAAANNLVADVQTADKMMHDLQFNKAAGPKAELRYAEAVELANKSPRVN